MVVIALLSSMLSSSWCIDRPPHWGIQTAVRIGCCSGVGFFAWCLVVFGVWSACMIPRNSCTCTLYQYIILALLFSATVTGAEHRWHWLAALGTWISGVALHDQLSGCGSLVKSPQTGVRRGCRSKGQCSMRGPRFFHFNLHSEQSIDRLEEVLWFRPPDIVRETMLHAARIS